MKADEASVLLDLLVAASAPSSASWGARVLEYGRLERHGPPEAIARALSALYAEPSPQPPQVQMIDRLERALFPAMATALQQAEGRLRERVHREHRMFLGEAPFREEAERPFPLAPTPAGWDFLGAFRVFSGEVVLHEFPSAPDAPVVRARNGVWFVWLTERPGSLLDRLFARDGARQYVICHEDLAPHVVARARRTNHRWRHDVEGGRGGIVDAEIVTDRRQLAEFEFGEPVQSRGAMLGLGGDGVAEWRGAKIADEVVLFTLDTDE